MPDNPFPLNIPQKVNTPELLAFFQQFGLDKYLSAEEINKMIQALNYLYQNMGSGGSMNQNNKVREVFIGFANNRTERDNLLNNTSMNVAADENIIVTYFTPFNQQGGYVQASLIWKKGKGEFLPIGAAEFTEKFFELPVVYPTDDSINQLITAPNAIVHDYGSFTGTILAAINNASPAVDLEDSSKIYYIRGTRNGVTYLWRFNGDNDTYGDGLSQMTEDDIEFLFSSNLSGQSIESLFLGWYDDDQSIIDNNPNPVEGQWAFFGAESGLCIGYFWDNGNVIYDDEDEDQEFPIPVVDLSVITLYDNIKVEQPIFFSLGGLIGNYNYSKQGFRFAGNLYESGPGFIALDRYGLIIQRSAGGDDLRTLRIRFPEPDDEFTPFQNIVAEFPNEPGKLASRLWVINTFGNVVRQIDGPPGSVINVGTSEALVYSLFVPANTLSENILNTVRFPFEKITAAATALQLKMYASNNEFTLGNQFAFYSNSAITRLSFTFERDFRISGGNLDPQRFPVGTTRLTNRGETVGNTPTTVSFDVTQNNWIHLTALHSSVSGDVQCLQGVLNYKKHE